MMKVPLGWGRSRKHSLHERPSRGGDVRTMLAHQLACVRSEQAGIIGQTKYHHHPHHHHYTLLNTNHDLPATTKPALLKEIAGFLDSFFYCGHHRILLFPRPVTFNM
jgi:hypothetical protein